MSDLRRERLAAQRLLVPAGGPVEATRALLAVQAQDPRGFRLAIRARTRPATTVSALERELTERRSLVVSWLNRGTLHLVTSEDWPWLHALTTPPLFTGSDRRLGQEGVTPVQAERARGLIADWLAADGALTRAELRERLQRAGIPTAGQALVHILVSASIRGVIVRGPVAAGGEQAYVLVEDWLGPTRVVDRDQALAELARRYLVSHAPATERDLARWAGLPLRDARRGLRALGEHLRERGDGLLSLRGQREPPLELPPPRLLGAYEPVLVGWGERGWLTGPAEAAVVQGGRFRPFALVEGEVAALWRWLSGRAQVEPLRALSGRAQSALEQEAAAVERFLSG